MVSRSDRSVGLGSRSWHVYLSRCASQASLGTRKAALGCLGILGAKRGVGSKNGTSMGMGC